MENDRLYIEGINAKLDAFCAEFESQWMEWSTESVIMWFRYKTMNMNNDNLDWEAVKKQLRARNITGKSLQKFNDLTFELLEINDFEVVQHLLGAIEKLRNQQRGNVKSIEPENIPERFLCPISKTMMTDPVMAFDGHCYERSAIEEYLKTHAKSPITGKSADYVIVFPNHRLRADIQAFVKEGKSSECTPSEGDNDTSWL